MKESRKLEIKMVIASILLVVCFAITAGNVKRDLTTLYCGHFPNVPACEGVSNE